MSHLEALRRKGGAGSLGLGGSFSSLTSSRLGGTSSLLGGSLSLPSTTSSLTTSSLQNVVSDTLRNSPLKPKLGSEKSWDTQSVLSERSIASTRTGASRVLEEAKAQRDARWEGYRSSFSGGSVLSRSTDNDHQHSSILSRSTDFKEPEKPLRRSPWSSSTTASTADPLLGSSQSYSSRLLASPIAEDRPSLLQDNLSALGSARRADRPGLMKDTLSASTPSLGRAGLFDSAHPRSRESSPRDEPGELYGLSHYGSRSLFSDLTDRPRLATGGTRPSDTASNLSGSSVSRGGYTGFSLSDNLNNVDRASSIADEIRSLTSLTSGLNSGLYNSDRPSARVEEPRSFSGDKEPHEPSALEQEITFGVPNLNLHDVGASSPKGVGTKPMYELFASAPYTERTAIDEGRETSTSGSPSPGSAMYQNWLDKLAVNQVEDKQTSYSWDVSAAQGRAPEDDKSGQASDLFPPENYATPRATNSAVSPASATFEKEPARVPDPYKTPPPTTFQTPRPTATQSSDGMDVEIAPPPSLYIGKLVQITPDAACLEEHVKACGMSWPSGPSGKQWTWKLGKTGFVEQVDFNDCTVHLSSDLTWAPLKSLVGFHNLSEEQLKKLKLDFAAKNAHSIPEVQTSSEQMLTPEKKYNPELERVLAEASPANMAYYVDCSKLISRWSSQLDKIQGLQLCRTKSLNDPVGIDSLQIVGWQTCVAGVDEGDDWLRVGDHYLPMKLAGVPVLSPDVYTLDNSGLKAKTRGLAYRSTTNVADKVGSHAIAPWGSLVHGKVLRDAAGAQWLRVGERFLPFSLNEVQVLVRSPVAGAGATQEIGWYEIVVDNTNGSRLGLELESKDDGSLLVQCIYGGLVLEWNCYHPDCMVAVGDCITWVDDPDRDTTPLLSKIQRKRRMTLRLERGST